MIKRKIIGFKFILFPFPAFVDIFNLQNGA